MRSQWSKLTEEGWTWASTAPSRLPGMAASWRILLGLRGYCTTRGLTKGRRWFHILCIIVGLVFQGDSSGQGSAS